MKKKVEEEVEVFLIEMEKTSKKKFIKTPASLNSPIVKHEDDFESLLLECDDGENSIEEKSTSVSNRRYGILKGEEYI